MAIGISRRAALGLTVAFGLAAGDACAQEAVTQFYKDKTFTFIAGSSAGGGVDLYTRLLARHLSKHLPGNPKVVPQNMPGAGSVAAAAHIYSNAPKDGTQVAMTLAGAILDPLTGGAKRTYEPTRFTYIANANRETGVCVVRADAPVKTFADAFKTELIVGGTGPGSAVTDYPLFLRNVFGAKIKYVGGYPGSREVSLAVQKGELHGVCGLAWSSAKLQYPEVLAPGGPYHVILQEDLQGNPVLDKMGVPVVTSLVKSEADRKLADVFYSQGLLNRVIFAPPEVPADRVAALRKAVMDTLADPELLAEAARMKADVEPTPGAEIQEIVGRIFASPPDIVERLKKAVEGKS